MEKQIKIFNSSPKGERKPLVMIELTSENDGLTVISESDRLAFNSEDIKTAETKGYAQGFASGNELGITQGELKANNAQDDFLKEIILQINQSLKIILESEVTFLESFFPSILRICLAVLHKAMPHFFQANGRLEMEALLREIIESLIMSTPIKVRVPELVHEFVVKHLHDTCSSYPETIDIIKAPDLTERSCQIEWAGGGAKWSLDEHFQVIEAKLQEYLTLHAA